MRRAPGAMGGPAADDRDHGSLASRIVG